jgi:DNA polymerase III sliding clamp (beta) subunit (PCNA family)
MRATINVNGNPNYPNWSPLSSVNFMTAPTFGESASRVMWAAEKGGLPQLSGFHLDGEFVICTDRYRVARYPMPLPDLKEPITIPAGRLGPLLRGTGDILVGVHEDLFVMMPDDYTEIRTVTYGGSYVPVEKIFALQYPCEMSFSKQDLIERVQRATHFAGSDRAPVLHLYLGRSQLAIMMQNPEVGQYGDVIDVPGQAEHDRITLRFTPAMILDALNNSPTDSTTLFYNPDATNRPVKINGGGGYECWLAPRAEITPS